MTELRRASNGGLILKQPNQNHTLFGSPVPAGGAVTLTRFATGLGKPAIAAEAGHAGTTNAEDVDVLVDGVSNVMRHLKMLPGTAAPVEHRIWLGRSITLTSQPVSGLIIYIGAVPSMKKGDNVAVIGEPVE